MTDVSQAGGQDSRTDALAAFTALHDALTEAARTFGHDATVANALIDALRDEPSITALANRFPISEERNRLASVLQHYETCRRDARLALWRVMLGEGCSIGEVARIFGLSRQLVSRQLRDSRAAQEPSPRDSTEVEAR